MSAKNDYGKGSSKFLTLEKYQNSLRLYFLKSSYVDYITPTANQNICNIPNLVEVNMELLTSKIKPRSYLSVNMLSQFPGHFFFTFCLLRYRLLYEETKFSFKVFFFQFCSEPNKQPSAWSIQTSALIAKPNQESWNVYPEDLVMKANP